MTVLGVLLAGGFGATLRWLLDLLCAARLGRVVPWGTMAANVAGSCVAGCLAGASLGARLGPHGVTILALGLCGGFTTFSAASFDTMRQLERRRPALGAALFFVPMLLALGGAVGGFYAAGA
jgi:CrcB protein